MLEFMSENPVLTVILALIVAEVICEVVGAWGSSRKGDRNDHS